jgi:hypothetical protein
MALPALAAVDLSNSQYHMYLHVCTPTYMHAHLSRPTTFTSARTLCRSSSHTRPSSTSLSDARRMGGWERICLEKIWGSVRTRLEASVLLTLPLVLCPLLVLGLPWLLVLALSLVLLLWLLWLPLSDVPLPLLLSSSGHRTWVWRRSVSGHRRHATAQGEAPPVVQCRRISGCSITRRAASKPATSEVSPLLLHAAIPLWSLPVMPCMVWVLPLRVLVGVCR